MASDSLASDRFFFFDVTIPLAAPLKSIRELSLPAEPGTGRFREALLLPCCCAGPPERGLLPLGPGVLVDAASASRLLFNFSFFFCPFVSLTLAFSISAEA